MLGDRKKKNFCLNGKLFHSQVFLISHLVIYSYFVHGVEDGEKENEENKRKWRMKNDGNVARFNDFLVAEQLEVFNFFYYVNCRMNAKEKSLENPDLLMNP